MSRAAIYVRISRDRAGAGLGVQRQESDCRDLAATEGHEVVGLYADNDLSAYSGKPRPEYLRLLGDIRAGLVDVVIAWHTDRLHRSPVELEDYISACEVRGLPTLTVKAGPLDLSTPSGRMVARQLGAVARYEVEHQIERAKRAKFQAATAGKWAGGQRPFGYEPDGVTIRAAEAEVVASVTEAILLGASLRAQAADLNRRGVTTSTGRTWTPTELRRVLVRPRNAGLREHQKKIVGEAQWPAIVAEEHWRAVSSILTDPARRTSWATNRKWMLSGVARCGVCGAPVRGDVLHSSRRSTPSYTCRANKCVLRNAKEVDQFVAALVVERLSRPDAAGLLQTESGPDLGALRAEGNALRQRLDDLAGLYAEGSIDARQLREGTTRIQIRSQLIDETIAEAGRRSVLAGVVDADDVAAAWEAIDDVDRRTSIVDALMAITIHRTKKGRPPGWRPGQSYFDSRTIEIAWKTGN
ncbi:recombinase family protein [Actinoplanes sp. NPDC051494]|uniref:recombinase family protein n=1 Tax=Actinoplanes sp. NPDC051494 TaxID=3363907 RepID=UPI0037A91456